MAQKIGKVSTKSDLEPIQGKRVELGWRIFGSQGPQGGPFSRTQATGKELQSYKASLQVGKRLVCLFEKAKGKKMDLTRLWAGGLANLAQQRYVSKVLANTYFRFEINAFCFME